jgi:cystathionine beta-lyase/cystathionine gamma-synthase
VYVDRLNAQRDKLEDILDMLQGAHTLRLLHSSMAAWKAAMLSFQHAEDAAERMASKRAER